MKLNKSLLDDQWSAIYAEDFNSCYNARGLYDTTQFVLRLRPDLHFLLEKVPNAIVTSSDIDFETFQAFSTYFHETIHWWQHIGSISGLILSLSYPAQAHINRRHLKDHIKHTGLVKPIIKYNELNAESFHPTDEEFKTINYIINNFHDIEFFKHRVINPNSTKSFINNPLFESLGHSFDIAYSSFINVIASSFDQELTFLPKADEWGEEFKVLRDKKIKGYYHGSDIEIPPIGLKDIYEGQARFLQLQYLYFGSGGSLTWEDFEDIGMLSGVYYSAFRIFLQLVGSERPKSIDSPLVALFLVVLDISMNPTNGFPFDLVDHESFIESVDPGIRFINLCGAIAKNYPELKSFVRNYSSAEYFEVSRKLSEAIGCRSPLDAAEKICSWAMNKTALIELMEEEKKFNFSKENLPIRLVFSRFIRYQEDKLSNPAFFCWTGVYIAGEKCSQESMHLFQEHQALFSDKADGDIYPRKFPSKDSASVQKTFDQFYTWVTVYDLSRQWIVEGGEFSYDYFWLTSKHSMEELKGWAAHNFKLAYGVEIDDFKVL